MKLFEIYCQQNGITPDNKFFELIEKVFQDGLNVGFDSSTKLKMISDETDHKLTEYSEYNWNNFSPYLADAFINQRRRLDEEFDQHVEESLK